ncbi:MAG TPA: hypothetical protein VJT31_15720 [Rugosimonospora sp.]|nr:hypothetical protein [Rugosimonospora sp.]
MDDDVYADFIAEVLAGGFAPPPAGEWSAEQIAAHVASGHEGLIRTTEAILSGEDVAYDNADAIDMAALDRYVHEYRGLRGLADRIAETAVTLRAFGTRLDEHGPVTVPVRIRDGDRVVVDRPTTWTDVLKLDAEVHVQRHLDQLRALRPPAYVPDPAA